MLHSTQPTLVVDTSFNRLLRKTQSVECGVLSVKKNLQLKKIKSELKV